MIRLHININCPYCGHRMEFDFLASQIPEVICELCGSPLNDEITEAIKNYNLSIKSKTESMYQTNQYGSGAKHQQVGSQTPFPKSSSRPIQTPPFSSPINTPSSSSTPSSLPPKNGALLVFPQIHKQIQILPTETVFYFGRNTILPLVSPSEYDVEWLNSISRVKKDSYKRIIHQHFIIRKERNGQYTIEDNRSRWGTWVNRQQIKGRGPIPLINGDKIELMLSKPGTKK